jgi:hypothetical protein
MQLNRRKKILAVTLAVGVLGIATHSARAGCGGGGGYWGGHGVRYASAGYYTGGYSRGGNCGMAMGAMNMAGMTMGVATAAPQAPAPAAQMPSPMGGMNMGGAAPSAATTPGPVAGAQYTCTMHPNVASNGPGKCPYCGMALTPRR